MNSASLRTSLAVSCFPLLAATAGLALAHTQTGSLSAGAAATDYYQVTCSDDGSGIPGSLLVQVENVSASGPLVSALVHKGVAATDTTDPVNGDAQPSAFVSVNGGGGVYNVFLVKTGAGAANYTLSYHCMTGANGSGLHTGTDIVFRQRGFPPG